MTVSQLAGFDIPSSLWTAQFDTIGLLDYTIFLWLLSSKLFKSSGCLPGLLLKVSAVIVI